MEFQLPAWLDLKSILFGLGGVVLSRAVSLYRGRVATLDYVVTHDRIGLSGKDAVLGDVEVRWRDYALDNIFASTLTLTNSTSKDLTGFVLRVFVGTETRLITERIGIAGTVFVPAYTSAYEAEMKVAEGQEATEAQIQTYRARRDYRVEVLNRGQSITATYLTTVPGGQLDTGPNLWCHVEQAGLRAVYRPFLESIHGVPRRATIPVGLVACVFSLLVVLRYATAGWVIALVCMTVGLFAQSIGAGLYKLGRWLHKLLLSP
jgi:hypothetical protein